MAVLSANELAEVRKKIGLVEAVVDYDKNQVNLAIQAIEDWFETNRGGIVTAINAATTPFVFTAQQKRRLVKFYLLQKSGREAL